MGLSPKDVARLGSGAKQTVARLRLPLPMAGANKAEMEWAAQLDAWSRLDPARSVQSRRVLRWLYEPMTFRLAKGTSYKPDFYVLFADAHVEIHEVKVEHGGKKSEARSGWSSTSITKFKIAAELFPEFQWVACEKRLAGSWTQTLSTDLFKRSR